MFRTERPAPRRRVGLRRLVFFLVAFVLSLLLLARVDTNAAPRVNSGQVNSSPAKFAGAFVDWGPVGREHTLQAWEKWLKQPPSSVVGVDFYGQANWEDFHKLTWLELTRGAALVSTRASNSRLNTKANRKNTRRLRPTRRRGAGRSVRNIRRPCQFVAEDSR